MREHVKLCIPRLDLELQLSVVFCLPVCSVQSSMRGRVRVGSSLLDSNGKLKYPAVTGVALMLLAGGLLAELGHADRLGVGGVDCLWSTQWSMWPR
jgi:hypothetical protein